MTTMTMVERVHFGPAVLHGAWIVVAVSLAIAGCSSEKPKTAQPTPEQVRSNADRTFDKLKQEEQQRNVQPPASR